LNTSRNSVNLETLISTIQKIGKISNLIKATKD